MIRKYSQWIVMLFIMSGCAQMAPMPPSQLSLLEDYKVVRGWSAVQTQTEVREREQRYTQTPSNLNRVRLALALGFGKGGMADPKLAIQLLDETIKNPGLPPSDEVLIAEVFSEILKERLQNENKLEMAEARISSLTKQAESERMRADELERKLEAIKVIEKSLRKR